MVKEEKQSGISPGPTELDLAVERIIEMEESADVEQQVNDAVKKQKEASDKSACFQEKGLCFCGKRVCFYEEDAFLPAQRRRDFIRGSDTIFHGRCLHFHGKATGFFEETQFIILHSYCAHYM